MSEYVTLTPNDPILREAGREAFALTVHESMFRMLARLEQQDGVIEESAVRKLIASDEMSAASPRQMSWLLAIANLAMVGQGLRVRIMPNMTIPLRFWEAASR